MTASKGPMRAVQFTRESAERIANVVRASELNAPAASPLTFEDRLTERPKIKQVRAATFSGAWPIGQAKAVTFTVAPTATASVMNLTWPITISQPQNTPCVVGKEGTAWYLISPKLNAKTVTLIESMIDGVIIEQVRDVSVVKGVELIGGFDPENCVLDMRLVVDKEEVAAITSHTIGPVLHQTASATILTFSIY